MPGITERVYYLTAMAGEKETAMAAWSNKLQEIVTGTTAPANVVNIGRQRQGQ
jgi:hypothetical protein